MQVVKNAAYMADCLKKEKFKLVSDGTDNHLVLVKLTAEGISGAEAADMLDKAGIIVNKNSIPFDETPSTVTSGIRLGTPAITTRGMKEKEVEEIVSMISKILRNKTDNSLRKKTRERG